MTDPVGNSSTGRRPTRALRRRTSTLIVITAMSLIAALVVAAVSAEGREISRATSNDGGAWLINRELSVVGHKNRVVGELSSFMRVLDSPQADVHQAGDFVVVHDPSTNKLIEVDTRSFSEDLEPTLLPRGSVVHAVDGAVVVVAQDPLTIWTVSETELIGLKDLSSVSPVHTGDGSAAVAVRADGTIVILEHSTMDVTWFPVDDRAPFTVSSGLPAETKIVDSTIVDDSLIALLESGDLVVVGDDGPTAMVSWALATDRPVLAKLQQPSGVSRPLAPLDARAFGGLTQDGELLEVLLDDGAAAVRQRGVLGGSNPLAPIAHDGCLFGVVTQPPTMGVACEDGFVARELAGAGQELRIRLINDWVWVNDLDDGGTWVTNDALKIKAIDDWGRAAPVQVEAEDLEDNGGEDEVNRNTTVVDDPDAAGQVQNSQEFDRSEANQAPIAVEDSARTRVDRPVIIDVLANDIDLNNDILVIDEVQLSAGQGLVTATASLQEVQVTPGPGFVGTIQFSYVISDGRGESDATTVVVDVLANEQANRPPEVVTDVVATAPGNSTTIDVVRNDWDPDGDALALVGISTETGTLRWAPSGQVTFTPDTTTAAGWIELPYVVADDLGAESAGVLRVEIRDRGANQEPDARNDQATTVTGRPIALQLLLNDSDPDGDPLIVSSRPKLLSPEDADVRTSSTTDGEFIFAADEPGTYLFQYSINDGAEGGSESDTAQIRIDVAEATANKPPIAVRDDVVVAVGETRTVYVLDNDGDPDGDVISIVDWSSSPGLLVGEFIDATGHVGFQVTADPSARRPTFSYSISDGKSAPVTTSVVVSLVNLNTLDQPPFALDDLIQARAGRTLKFVDVLGNDFDPEGGSLWIVGTGEVEGAVITVAADRQSLAIDIAATTKTSFTVPYDIEDSGGNRAAGVLRVQMIGEDEPNRPPIARADEARISVGESVAIVVLRNDSDPDADAIALQGVADQPANGQAVVTANGIIQYTPAPDFTGTDVFRYTVVDAEGDDAVGDVFIGVTDSLGENSPPIANDDSYTLNGRPTTTPLNVILNDFDPEGDPLRVVNVTTPEVGSVAIDVFGRVEFIPPESLSEATVVTFDYVISDTANNQARATVSIELEAFEDAVVPTPPPILEAPTPTPEPTPSPLEPTPTPTPEPTPTPTPTPTPEEVVNQPPLAVNDDRGPVRIGTTVEVDVLSNDFDPDGDDFTLVGVTGGSFNGGIVTLENLQESVQITYTIRDSGGLESSAILTVLVIENQAPSVAPFATQTGYETPIQLDLSSYASDPDFDNLVFICCEDRRNGEVTEVVANPNEFRLVFTPATGFVGQAAFSYRVDDLNGHQTAGSVTIDVLPPGNRAPDALDDSIFSPQAATVNVDLAALVEDPDGDALIYWLGEGPAGPIDVTVGDGVAFVTTDRNAPIGPAGSFTYFVSDGVLEDSATIAIEVIEGENAPPEVVDFDIELAAASSATVDLGALTTDPDLGDSLSWALSGGTDGPVTATVEGPLMQIVAPAEAVGSELSIPFVATDSRDGSASAFVNVTVLGPQQPDPAVVPDEAIATRGQAVLIDVVANDVDPLGEGLIVTLVEASWGTATIVDNQVRFAPGDRVGTASLTYTIEDRSRRPASGTITVDTVAVPEKPAPPKVVADSGQVTISWDEPSNNGRSITAYAVTSSTGETKPTGVQNSLVWDGLTNGESYTFAVVATNEIGDSLSSDPSLPAIPNQVPETPAPPTVAFGSGELTVTWQPPENAGSEITGYELEIGPTSAVEPIAAGETSFTWQGLTNGQDYTFRVRAKNDAGFSFFSELSAPEHPSMAPSAPTIRTTELGNLSGSLVVRWARPVDNGDPITGYRIESSASTFREPPTADDLQYEWQELDNGTDFAFRVQARNRSGWGEFSDWSNFIPPCGVPAPAANLVAVRGDGRVELTWEPSNARGCAVTGYIISAAAQGAATNAIQNSENPGHTFTGLVNGIEYTFTVRAENQRGIGGSSAPSNPIIPAGPPRCPDAASMTATIEAARAVDLSWTNLIANGSPIQQYIITVDGSPFSPGADPLATNRRIPNLTNATEYSFSVSAINDVGESPACASVRGRTWDVPTAVEVQLDWDAENEKLIAVAFGGDTNDGATEQTHSWTLEGLTVVRDDQIVVEGSPQGTTQEWDIDEDGVYRVTVEACNAAGCVNALAELEVTLPKPPEPLLASDLNLNSELLSRDPSSGLVGSFVFVTIAAPIDDGLLPGSEITDYNWEAELLFAGSLQETFAASEPISNNGTFFLVDFLPGHSSYQFSSNQGLPATWRLRAQAVNAVGESEWSPWVEITPETPSPIVEARERRGCGSDSCVQVEISVYGFEPNSEVTPSVSADGGQRGDCQSVTLDGAGSFRDVIECEFNGGDEAPNSYRVSVNGYEGFVQ